MPHLLPLPLLSPNTPEPHAPAVPVLRIDPVAAANAGAHDLARAIEQSGGVVAAWEPGFTPNHHLEVSREAACRFLTLSDAETRGSEEDAADPAGPLEIAGFDFSRISTTRPIVVTLPALVDGREVRAAAGLESSRLRLTMRGRLDSAPQNGWVAALVLPDTIESVGRGVVGSLAPRHVLVSKSVTSLDVTGLASGMSHRDKSRVFSPHANAQGREEGIDFAVQEGNPAYRAVDGSLYSADGSRLILLALPCDETLVLKPGVARIEPTAYVRNPVREVVAPASLEDVSLDPDSGCLWVFETDTPLRRRLEKRGWMTAVAPLARRGRFVYDLLPDGSARVVRCEGDPADLRIPDELDGRPVREVGNNAIPASVRRLVVADSVTSIAGHAPCPNLASLTLPARLERLGAMSFSACRLAGPVTLPATLTHIGGSSLGRGLYTFASTGATVLIDQLFSTECYVDGVPPLDFGRYDEKLSACLGLEGDLDPARKVRAVLARLASPYRLAETSRERYLAYLALHARQAVEGIARTGDVATLERLLAAGRFPPAQLDAMAVRLASAGQAECAALVLEFKHRAGGAGPGADAGPSAVKRRFSL